jgi:hypothetical protein
MTKTKSKSKAKKAKKDGDLPKKVAGTKVPKAVRSNSLLTMFNTSLGREILADALMAAAGAAAAALTRTRTAKQVGSAVADAGSTAASNTADAMQTASGAVATVITEAARNFLPPSLVGGENDARGSQDTGDKPRYVNLASDHNSRRKSKTDKAEKPGKRP